VRIFVGPDTLLNFGCVLGVARFGQTCNEFGERGFEALRFGRINSPIFFRSCR